MNNPERTKLKLTGLTCANCATTIERSIRGLEGVSDVNVNLAETSRLLVQKTSDTSIPSIHSNDPE
jgi:Cu+-exporting ATPase